MTIGLSRILLLAIAGFAVTSCGSKHTLAGTDWRLDAIATEDGSIEPVLAGTALTASFTADQVTGSGGCNSFFGPYAGDGQSFSAGPIGSTLMACEPAVSDQEFAYLGFLNEADEWTRANDLLELHVRGRTVLRFSPAPVANLTDAEWLLTSLNNNAGAMQSAVAEVTITFDEDELRASGSGGCNSYNSTYERNQAQIIFGPVGATKRFCSQPEGIMDQEARFFTVLGRVASFRITPAGVLEMFDGSNSRQLQFARRGEEQT